MTARDWLEIVFYVCATVGCGTFFTWLVRRIDTVSASLGKLRAHEHSQNNVLQRLGLQMGEVAEDVGVIRQVLGVPRKG